MSIKERNEAIVESVLQQIKNEAETQRILTGEYAKNYNVFRYLRPFSGANSFSAALAEEASGLKKLACVVGILGIIWVIKNRKEHSL